MTNPGGNPNLTPNPEPRDRLKPWERLELIAAIAAGTHNQTELGIRFGGRSQQLISQFARNHAREIEAVREAHGDPLAALWIARRTARIAAYEEQAEVLRKVLAAADDAGSKPDPALVRAYQSALRNVAEELGQLTTKIETAGQIVYRLEGVDIADLT